MKKQRIKRKKIRPAGALLRLVFISRAKSFILYSKWENIIVKITLKGSFQPVMGESQNKLRSENKLTFYSPNAVTQELICCITWVTDVAERPLYALLNWTAFVQPKSHKLWPMTADMKQSVNCVAVCRGDRQALAWIKCFLSLFYPFSTMSSVEKLKIKRPRRHRPEDIQITQKNKWQNGRLWF